MRATLEIQRFDADRDARPHAQRFTVELPEGSTVLEGLMAVQDSQDGSLAFRRACRHGICGACAMRINGCSRLACNTQLSEAVERATRMAARRRQPARPGASPRDRSSNGTGDDGEAVVAIAPLGNMPVVKDLVTDMEVFWRKLRRVRPWLQPTSAKPDPDRELAMTPRQWDRVAEAVLCLECGACYSECDALASSPEFIGPTALTRAHRFVVDPRDGAGRERLEALSNEHGLWECTRCYFCTQRCPKHIRVRELIADLGAMAFGKGARRDPGARHAEAFVDSLRESGRLNEATLGVKSQGSLWTARHAPHLARLARAGKLPPLRPTAIDERETLRRVMDRVSEAETNEAKTEDLP